ncbi:hypothetical protein HOLleu_20250 [Holothuria leucospilota]|uniref:Receptor ligand binding region domain-containing protein n=1 Tax=Holothuria leucospilota TaxID=206669 RepID=A0A9Q1H7V8_HOLLE|nr:hypothetical protein HOLleu_20250 [Holothuria leucospilota]
MFLVAVFLCFVVISHTHTAIRIGLVLGRFGSRLDQTQLKPPFDIALKTVSGQVERGGFLNFTFTTYLRETVRGGQRIGSGLVADLVNEHDIHVVFGHPSSSEMVGIGDLVAHWNIPALTTAAINAELEDRRRFTTFTRTAMRAEAIGWFITRLFGVFKWNLCTLIYTEGGPFDSISNAVLNTLKKGGVVASFLHIDNIPQNATEWLLHSKERARSKLQPWLYKIYLQELS